MFETEGIDHIAIAVRDVRKSAEWYRKTLGLQRQHEEVWGDFPAMVGAGTTSIALFPVSGDDPKPRPGRDTVAMRHFAFRVTRANFERAKEHLRTVGIEFTAEHHEIAESIYLYDPDGHEVEITTYDVTRNKREKPSRRDAEGVYALPSIMKSVGASCARPNPLR